MHHHDQPTKHFHISSEFCWLYNTDCLNYFEQFDNNSNRILFSHFRLQKWIYYLRFEYLEFHVSKRFKVEYIQTQT